MFDLVQIAKDYATVINTFVIIVLLFKYLSDVRKQGLEYRKLEIELARLKEVNEREKREIIRATQEDIRRFVVEPMIDEIKEGYREHHKLQSNILQDFHYSLERMAKKSFVDSSDFRDTYRHLIHCIEKNSEAMLKLESVLRSKIEEREKPKSG